MEASIQAYRQTAAASYLSHNQSITETSNTTAPEHELHPYTRDLFPALYEYLTIAAIRYNTWLSNKTLTTSNVYEKLLPLSRILGEGTLASQQKTAYLRERWLKARAIEKHRKKAIPSFQPFTDIVQACHIPSDIRHAAATRFASWCAAGRIIRRWVRCKLWITCTALPLGDFESCQGIQLLGFRVKEHISHCRSGQLSNENRHGKTKFLKLDSAEEVRARYLGRPDEIYRRKTARRYATWRRLRLEEERKQRGRVGMAESHMRRRRGHDLLLSGRRADDSSFAPFLFESGERAYAFSSRISEAPKLRKVMVKKYTEHKKVEDSGAQIECDQWERAQRAAKENPLFHTRVMNRFG